MDLFGNKAAAGNQRIAALTALLAVAAGPSFSADAALPTPEAFAASLREGQQGAIDAAVTAATTPLAAEVAGAKASAAAYLAGISAAGVKLGTFSAADFTPAAGKSAADTVAAGAIKTAIETAIAAKSARQIAATGHEGALDIPAGEGTGGSEAAAVAPANVAEFKAGLNTFTDPGQRNTYFRKHKAKFGL